MINGVDHILNSDLAAILTIIAALTTSIVSIIKIAHTNKVVKDMKPTVDKIYVNTNGERERLLREVTRRDITIELQRQRIDQLEKQIGNRRFTDKKLSDNSYKD